VAFAAYFAPYFLIPAAFRFAGGVMATLGGFANDRSRGAFDRLKGYRKGQTEQKWNDLKHGNRFRGGTESNFRGMINRGLAGTVNAPGAIMDSGALGHPSRWQSALRASTGNQEFEHAMEASEKDAALRAIIADDDALTAARAARTGGVEGVRQAFIASGRTGDHLDTSVEEVMAARRSIGDSAFDIAAVVATAGTKTGFAGGVDEMMTAIDEASGGNKSLASRMFGAARGQAGRAGRVDLAGHGFGHGAGQLFTEIDRGDFGGGTALNDALNVDTFQNSDLTNLGRGDSRAVENVMNSVQGRIISLSDQHDAGTLDAAGQAELGRLSARLEMAGQLGQYIPEDRMERIQAALRVTSKARGNVQAAAAKDHDRRDIQTGQRQYDSPLTQGYIEQRDTSRQFNPNDPRNQGPDEQ
jgi:hypothetical protein